MKNDGKNAVDDHCQNGLGQQQHNKYGAQSPDIEAQQVGKATAYARQQWRGVS